MIFELLEPLFGRYATDRTVITAFAALGVDNPAISLPDGEFSAYVERPADGYAIAFTDESYFRDSDEPIGSTGRLVLTGLFLYLVAIDDYEPFAGEVPLTLSRTDSRPDIIRKLGSPADSRNKDDGSVWIQHWVVRPHCQLSITYSALGNPSVLSYHVTGSEA